MACEIFSINGNSHSELAKYLSENINNENDSLTEEHMAYFRSKPFIDSFGNYIDAYKVGFKGEFDEMLNRVNDTMEPLLQLDSEVNKHYYLDKNNDKVYFPLADIGLRSILSNEDITRVSSRLALNYFKKFNNGSLDFNEIDFESGEKLPDLNSFVLSEINSKIEELSKSDKLDDMLSIEIIEPLTEHVEELANEVSNFFKRISLKVVEDENSITSEDIDNEKEPGFGISSVERDSKASVTSNVKLRLSLLESTTEVDPIWNEPVFMKFDEVYGSLLTTLTNTVDLPSEDIWDIYKDNLARVLSLKPHLRGLYEDLTSDSFTEAQQNEFIQAFRLNKNNHQISKQTSETEVVSDANGMIVYEDGKPKTKVVENKDGSNNITFESIGISDSGSKTTKVLEDWFNEFKTKFVNKDNSFTENSLKELKSITSAFAILHNSFNKLKLNYNEKDSEIIVNNFIKGLSELGINATEDFGFNNYLTDYNNNLTTEFRIKRISEVIYRTALGMNSMMKTFEANPKEKIYENPLFKASYIFKELAKYEAFFVQDNSDSTVRSGGKQKFIYSYPSYISTKIAQWKKNPLILLELLNSSEHQKGSFLLKYLTGKVDQYNMNNDLSESEQLTLSKSRLEEFDLGIFNQMEVDGEFAPTTELSMKDYITDTVNKTLLNSFKRTITPADKGTDLQVKTGVNLTGFDGIQVNEEGESEALISNPVKKVYFEYFASEFNRMIEARNEVNNSKDGKDLTIHYHFEKGKDPKSMTGNAFKSQYFERLSPDAKNLTAREKVIHDLIYADKFPSLDKLVHDRSSDITIAIENYIETELLKGISKTYNNLIRSEIIIKKDEGNDVLNNLDSSLVTKYNKFNSQGEHGAALAVATDFYLNSVSQAIEYTNLFTGDMAYFKNAVDFKKRIPSTYTDGLQLRLKPGQEFFKIAVVNSVMRKSPFYDEIAKDKKLDATPYANINSADAQAWITPQRWKFLVHGLGKWSKTHDSLFEKMTSDKPVEYTEKELKIAAQPLKGVYFYRDANGKPVYLKYSQAVLTKALVKGSDLESIFNKMVDNNIDETITLDGIKVGALTPSTIHYDNGNLRKDFELNPQTLHNRGWKLQQDLPTKTFKDTDVGSQIQKNIFAGLNYNLDNDVFELDGKLVNGQKVADEIVKTVLGLSDRGLNNIKKEFGIDKNYEIKNIKGFYNVLIKDLESKNGSENVINALKAEIALPGIPQAGSKLINIFNSVMTDRLIKIKTNGGSFIQMSNFGLNKDQAIEKGVMWAPDSELTTSEPKRYLDPVTLRETIKPGGILISGSFLKSIPNWRSMDPKDLFGYTKKINASEIYSKLGNKTVNDNIIIKSLYQNAGVEYAKENNSIFSLRVNNSDKHFGNSFSSIPAEIAKGLTATKSTKESVEKYIDWVISSQEERAQWIRDQIKSGKLDSKKIIYYKELNEPSHATALDYLIKNKEVLENKEEFVEGAIDSKILNNIIGYRIPNQGLASNDALRIVGILPESNGDTVVAYTGITTKTGSDFDVDKMFIMFPSFNNNEGKLKYSENSLENRLIELYKSVLTSTELYADIMRPIDIELFNDEINSLFEKQSLGNLGTFDPFEDISLRYLFLSGKAGVGIEANALVDISRTGNLYFNEENIGWGHVNQSGETDLNQQYSKELSKKDMEYYLSVFMKGEKDQSKIDKLKSEISKFKVGDSYTAILNGFVDIANNPTLPKGNWTTKTTNVGNLMIRAGVHPLYVINFLAQPVIKQYNEFESNNEGLTNNNSGDSIYKFNKQRVSEALETINPKYAEIYRKDFSSLNIDYKVELLGKQLEGGMSQESYDKKVKELTKRNLKITKAIAKEFGEQNVKKVISEIQKTHDAMFNPSEENKVNEASLEDLRTQITGKQNIEFQSAVIAEFKRLQTISKKLAENINVSKADTVGPGKNINSLFAIMNLKQHILDKENNIGALKGMSSKFVNSPLGVYFDKLGEVAKIVNANPSLFPQGQFQVQDMFNTISQDLYQQPAINAEMMSDLEVDYGSYVIANFFGLSYEESANLFREFPKQFESFKRKHEKDYFMLQELNVKAKKNSKEVDLVSLNNRKKSPSYEKAFVDSWNDLFNKHPKMAEDLVKYSFITSGFKMNANQFFTYIPYQYFAQKNINKYVRGLSDKNQEDFIDLFYRNNLTNKKYVKKLLERDLNINKFKDVNGIEIPMSEGFKLTGLDKVANYYIEVSNKFYKLEGYSVSLNSFGEAVNNPIYVAVKSASININGKQISNYSPYRVNDVYNVSKENLEIFRSNITENRESEIENEIKSSEEVFNEIDNYPKETITLWNEFKDNILEKHPNESIDMIQEMINEMGIEEVKKQLKECY